MVSQYVIFSLLGPNPRMMIPHSTPAILVEESGYAPEFFCFLANVNSRSRSWVHVRYILSPTRRPSVVCRLSSVSLVHPTQAVVIFGNFSTAFGTLAIRWHAQKILWRSSQGNPSVGGVKPKRDSKI